MSWDARFLEACSRRKIQPRYILEYVPVAGYLPGAGLSRHSHSGWIGYPATITRVGSSVSASHLQIRTWICTTGSLAVGLLPSGADPRRTLPRGALVRLKVGFPGWSDGDYEPVFFGQIADIRWNQQESVWSLEVKSILGALISRFTQEDTQTQLFYELTSTTLTAGYSVGAASISVNSTTGLDRLDAGFYLIRITPDSGDPFYLRGTGKTAGTVTGLDATGQFGTTAAAAASGNTVEFLAFLYKNPAVAAATILTSTGLGTNGAYDDGPASWGLGLNEEYIDVGDIATTSTLVQPASGSDAWTIYTGEPQNDASAFIRSFLQLGGMWLAERQGRITVRAVQDIGHLSYGLSSIYDRDIIDIRYSAWDPSTQAEYAIFELITRNSGSITPEGSLDSRPVLDTYSLDFTELVEDNVNEHLTILRQRLLFWFTVVGEAFEIVLVGWKYAGLTPGDHVVVSSRYLSVRYEIEGLAMVTSVQVDWFGATTTLRCVHIQNSAEFP